MNAEHLTLIEDCETRESRLDDWERKFIDDMRTRIEAGHSLTVGQEDTLDSIWNRCTEKG